MIWDVKNFYSNLERVCEGGSKFSPSYFALVVASSLLATGGLLANSAPVIIGAMCAAPFLGPSRAVCVGWVYKKWKTAVKGLIKQLLGLLAIGSTIAFLVTLAFLHLIPEVTVTPETVARTIPTTRDAYLAMFIAILSGVVASLALVARRKMAAKSDQQPTSVNYNILFDVTIGVEIAISLIPPASVVGMGLAFGRFDIFHHSLGLLLVNVWGLNIGGMIILYLWGVEPKPLQLEKKIRRIIEKTINDVLRADEITSEVTLHSYKKADVNVGLCTFETPDRVYR
ncbi:MAG: DUF389 domain-containing protein, partial [Phycisphaerae bacterium]|nr:DUF389 domain-containing protein [Phycisphaerae bacterium]